jgi:uncharacterized protein (DUF2164 family)
MSNDGKIKLTKEQREVMLSAIMKYFLKEREEDLGDLASGLILEFIMEKLAPEIYNQGVYDSFKFMENRIEELLLMQK